MAEKTNHDQSSSGARPKTCQRSSGSRVRHSSDSQAAFDRRIASEPKFTPQNDNETSVTDEKEKTLTSNRFRKTSSSSSQSESFSADGNRRRSSSNSRYRHRQKDFLPESKMIWYNSSADFASLDAQASYQAQAPSSTPAAPGMKRFIPPLMPPDWKNSCPRRPAVQPLFPEWSGGGGMQARKPVRPVQPLLPEYATSAGPQRSVTASSSFSPMETAGTRSRCRSGSAGRRSIPPPDSTHKSEELSANSKPKILKPKPHNYRRQTSQDSNPPVIPAGKSAAEEDRDLRAVRILFDDPVADKVSAVERINKLSGGFKLVEKQLELGVKDDSGKYPVIVECPDQRLAKKLVDAINGVTVAENVKALLVESQHAQQSVKNPTGKTNSGGKQKNGKIKSQRQPWLEKAGEDDLINTGPCLVSVYLRKKVDSSTATEYISTISQFRLDESQISVNDVISSDGSSVVEVKCPSKRQAGLLVTAINKVSAETTVKAELKSHDQITLENVWTSLCAKGQKQIETHQQKIDEVNKMINDAEASMIRLRRGAVDLAEFERVQAIKKPLKSKLEELRKQKEEFVIYMDHIKVLLQSVEQTNVFKARVEQIRKEFGLELGRFDSALPMYSRKSDIVRTITDNRVCIILGETGSGKSTQILQYLHDTALVEHGTIVCTQPRKVAAISLARLVSAEMGTTVGKLVGYQVGMQSRRGPDTRLVYMTDHALLNECLKDPLFTKYSCIVVDEAHERSIYSDLLLGFLKRAVPQRSDLHVVIMSATINPELFQLYFAGIGITAAMTVEDTMPPILEISGRAFPVDVYYEESSEDYTSAAFTKALQVHREEPAGDILVFLTSPIETEKACKNLQARCTKNDQQVLALELHGRLQVEDQQKVFEAAPPGTRKIVFATNTAETSITIPGIKYVIDTGRVREVSYDAKKNMSILAVQWVTQSSAEQRKGRAGRTDCGKCYRLYMEAKYDEFRRESVPEIMRVHLGQAMLKLMMLGVTDPTAFDFVQAPCQDALQSALSVLKELEAYDENGITEIGQKMAKLSLEPRLGKVALLGIDVGIPLESALMAAVTTVGGSIFFRAGSDEQKEQADRRKTRFCDEWGDIITLVAVYKEWDKVPEKNRSRWCVENSINGKSMRAARDILNEIKQTFRSELGVTIPNTYSECTEVNEDMAKILFDCYPSNLSRFCGHSREGFCLAKDRNVVMHVHPSSALNFLEVLPKWVVFEQVLTTSRTFMLNATFVRESWIMEKIASGRLDLVPARLALVIVEPQPLVYVGSQCIRKLLERKAQSKKDLEAGIKSADADAKFQLDIKSFENNCGGTLEVFTTPEVKELTMAFVLSQTWATKKCLADETIENQLLQGSLVRFVLERGAQIRTIMMPNEHRQIKITNVKDEGTTEGQVRQMLSRFGDIENVKASADTRNANVWGYVTFKLPQEAAAAVAAKQSLADSFTLELSSTVIQTANNHQGFDYTVKVTSQRRPLRGFGFVAIPDVEDIFRLASHVLRVRKPNGFSEGMISVQVGRGNESQLYLRSIPSWCTVDMIRAELHKVDPTIRVGNITLPRGQIPSAEESARLVSCFYQTIDTELTNSGEIQRQDFHLDGISPREKDYDMRAFLHFADAVKAQLAVNILNEAWCNDCQLDAALDLKAIFTIPHHIHKFCQAAIQNEIRELQSTADGAIQVEAKKHHMKPGLDVFLINTSCLHDFATAKHRLGKLLLGHRVNLTKSQLSFIKSAAGQNIQAAMEQQMNYVKIRIDDQQCAAFVHASSELITVAENRLAELLRSGMPEVIQDIQLRDTGFPKGLMKALVVNYGPDLDGLKVACNLLSLDLLLRQHTIRLQGSKESADKLQQLLRETAATLPPPIAEPDAALVESLPDCPVCMTPVEKEKLYVAESCSHVYCRECASNLVENSLRNNDIPVRCAADGCRDSLAIQDLRNLIGKNLEQVYEPAIRTFMMSHAAEYSYCISPNCRMIYRKAAEGQGLEFTCSECGVSLCTACNTANHAGMTCSMYHQLKTKGEVAVWMEKDAINRAQCPKCKYGIEKDGGCMHVECTACHAHICWRCKDYFADSGACYGHLQAKHEGYL